VAKGSEVPQVDGFLNLCKPLGWTSHDVVGFVRRQIGQKRVGHAGTLDPAASGVLPVCLGRATRLVDRISASTKLYAADVVLGLATDSGDAEGRLVHMAPLDQVALDQVVAALARQLGTITQRPPAYSALKVAGVPAYERARRGELVVLAPRTVSIYGLAVLGWQPPRLSLAIHCSKGTYVRSIAADLGEALGCGAYVDPLVRLAVGRFRLEDALSVEDFEQAASRDDWRGLVVPPDAPLLEVPALVLGAEKAGHFAHGRSWAGLAERDEARAYGANGRLLGLARAEGAGTRWQPALSFVYDPGVTDDREHGDGA
jgi:tRNA pseudouridine55 synthase